MFEHDIPAAVTTDIFANYLRRTLREVSRELDCDAVGVNYDYIEFRLEQLCNLLLHSENFLQCSEQVFSLDLLQRALSLLQNNTINYSIPVVEVERSGRPGRPKINISDDTIKALLELNFKVMEIAEIFGVHVRTIHRRMESLNIRNEIPRYTEISDEQLDEICKSVSEDFPNCGIRRMRGFLSSRGVHVTWERVRKALRRTDAEGVLIRTFQLNVVQRRVYSLRGPLALWHIDGNHKLIR